MEILLLLLLNVLIHNVIVVRASPTDWNFLRIITITDWMDPAGWSY